jgi:hypothetical protein
MPWSIQTLTAKVDKWAPHLITKPVILTARSRCPILAAPGAGWRISILRVLLPLKRRPIDDLQALLVCPHCFLATLATLVRACRDLCPAVPTTLPEVVPACPAPFLAALPIVLVHLIQPSASGHLWSPLDGVGDDLPRHCDEPMLQCRSGHAGRCTSGCRPGGDKGDSGHDAGDSGNRMTTNFARAQPGKRSRHQFCRLPLPGCQVVPVVLHLLHQSLLDGPVEICQRSLEMLLPQLYWLSNTDRAGNYCGSGAGDGHYFRYEG